MSMLKRVLWLLAAVFWLVACGQKGPLYMEGRVPKSQKRTEHIITSTPEPAPVPEPSAPN
jgi:predicted small lipoprotein YifL